MTNPFDLVDVERLRARRTVKWSLYGPEVLAAWVAEMDFDVAPVIRGAIEAAVAREDFGYLDPSDELERACAGFLAAEHGWEVAPARVFPVADVLAGIAAALDVHVPPRAPVVVPTPAYPPFFEVIEHTGRPVAAAPMVYERGRAALDLDAVERGLRGGARAVLLCNPHNPTGRVFDDAELGALATLVERYGARVVADEVHAPLVYPGARFRPYATVSDASAAHTTTVTSASKACNLAGLKCAQVVTSNHADASAWRALGVFAVPRPTPIGVAASVAAYREARPWIHDLVAYLDGNRTRLAELLAAELPEIGCVQPEATFLAWLDCSALGFDDPARAFLERGRVALNDGPPFGPGCEQRVRLNFATSRDLLDRIVVAMGSAGRAT